MCVLPRLPHLAAFYPSYKYKNFDPIDRCNIPHDVQTPVYSRKRLGKLNMALKHVYNLSILKGNFKHKTQMTRWRGMTLVASDVIYSYIPLA